MQTILPVSGKNSHLFSVIAQGKILVYFSFADYEENTSFSRYATYPLPSDFEISLFDALIRDILITWGSDIGLDLRTDSSGIFSAIFFQSQQIGGTSLIVDKSHYLEGYKSRVLNCGASPMGDDERLDYAAKYMRIFKPSDLLWVNIGWDKISVYFISKVGGVNSQEADIKEFSIDSDLMDKDMAAQLQNVIGVHIEKDNIRNILSNVLQKKIVTSTSTEVWDVLRSFVTTSLIKVKDSVFKSFGMKTDDAHLVITGDMSSVLSSETLFLSVIDGLQIRGRYRVILDRDQKSIVFGESLRGKSFVLPLAGIFEDRFLYLSCETDARTKEGDLAFTGKLESNLGKEGFNQEEIVGQVGYFHTFDLGGTGRITITSNGSVYFPNLARDGKNLVADFSSNDDKIIFDCRKIPIVYGPDENANLQRIKSWINGLKLSRSD